jgi:hypothetical protein
VIADRVFDKKNSEAARVILADIDGYGGEQAGLVRWARAVEARLAASYGALRRMAVARSEQAVSTSQAPDASDAVAGQPEQTELFPLTEAEP